MEAAATVERSVGFGPLDQERSRGGEWLPSNVGTYSDVAAANSAATASAGDAQSGAQIGRRALVATIAVTALASGAAGSALGSLITAAPARRTGPDAAPPVAAAAPPPPAPGNPVAALDLTALYAHVAPAVVGI